MWFQEKNRVGGVPESENVREEADNDNGVLLLAAVASGLKRTVDKKVKQGVRKIYPDDISRWSCQIKLNQFVMRNVRDNSRVKQMCLVYIYIYVC